MAEALFRQEVIDARRHRLAGTVVAAVPPSSRLYTMIVAAVALIALLVLAFGNYAVTANVRGIVAYDAGLARVATNAAGEVRQILVVPGTVVKAGMPLVSLSTAQGSRGLAEQIAQIERQLEQIDHQLVLAGSSTHADAAALDQQRSGLAETIASLERQQTIGAGQIDLAERGVARYGRLAKQGAASQSRVDEARNELLTRRATHEALGERLTEARTKTGAIALQINQRALDGDKSRSLLLAQRAALVSQREDFRRADNIILTAPVAGEVTDISAEVGQHVAPNASLVTIVPAGSRIEAWLYAPSNAIGFARPGERVRLRFDAYPYQKYGWGEGTVIAISRAPIDPAMVDGSVRPAEPSFRVRVSIASMGAIPMPRDTLRPGMTLSADLVLRQRSLIALLFGQINGMVGA